MPIDQHLYTGEQPSVVRNDDLGIAVGITVIADDKEMTPPSDPRPPNSALRTLNSKETRQSPAVTGQKREALPSPKLFRPAHSSLPLTCEGAVGSQYPPLLLLGGEGARGEVPIPSSPLAGEEVRGVPSGKLEQERGFRKLPSQDWEGKGGLTALVVPPSSSPHSSRTDAKGQ